MEDLRIVEQGTDQLEDYASIPISFTVESRLDLSDLTQAKPVEPYFKDYDQLEHPTSWPQQFDTTNWRILAAYEGDQRVGGAVIAWKSPGFDMLQGREDLAVMADLRIHPAHRGQGIGRALFNAAVDWAKPRGCTEMIVETQDTNVPACNFYSAMGFRLASIDPQGYGADWDEAKLIWSLPL